MDQRGDIFLKPVALSRFALQFSEAEAVQLFRDARQQEQRGAV